MDVKKLSEWVEATFEFPVTATEVVERAGDREIEAPDQTDSETLTTILDRSNASTFQSKEDLLNSIRGNLSDEYIGRKYYDDRGSNPSERESDTGPDTGDESF